MQNKKGFTLVELIVVITILAILGTIAFISFQGYSKSARDSKRVSDVNNIETSLELFMLQTGKYPLPDNVESVTYSGGTIAVWDQGTVGDTVSTQLGRNLNQKPLDPLFQTEYTYSTTPSKKEYEIMSLYESDLAINNINQAKAATAVTVRVDGTYNGVYVRTGDYIIPTPSIITSEDPMSLDFNATTIDSQVIDGGTNIPDVGNINITQSTGGLTFGTLEVYNGSLGKNSPGDDWISVYDTIINTYSGSSITSNDTVQVLFTQTTDEEKIAFTKTIILDTNDLVALAATSYSCNEATKPADNGHITYVIGIPTSDNQAYIKDASNCGYSCTDGYTGSSCEISPWACGDNISAGGYSYTTIIGLDGNCWTSTNMKHVPSAGSSWCYGDSQSLCDSDGRLYNWSAANHSSVCGALGAGWSLPTDAQWLGLSGATGWTGNKAGGIISKLPGYRDHDGVFEDRNNWSFRWSSDVYSPGLYTVRRLWGGDDQFIRRGETSVHGYSVVCTKN